MTVKKMLPYFMVLVLVLVGVEYYLISNQTNNPTNGNYQDDLTAPRENSENKVTIAMTYLNPTSSQYKDSLAFQVSMNTHSVELGGYDFNTIAYLKTASGDVIKPEKWEEADASGGHHRSGVLLFPKTDTKLELGNFDIFVEDVAQIDQRIFSW
ncbi:MAG: hypothetical protein E4G94_01905 [ANME-2 cluster archaeon]|nr:MAG: hypothetical protein E4G94_01905 [ANME-2 cluster archaeon]